MNDEIYPRFFNPSELGASMKEVSTEIIRRPDSDVISRWFHSAQDADLFVWMDENRNVIKQQISFYGQVVEWNIVEGLRTGLIIEDEDERLHKGADVVRFDQQPQKTPIQQALALLQHIAGLKEDERQALVSNFEDGRTFKSMSPQDFLKKFGPKLDKPGRRSLWQLLRRLFTGN